MQCWWGCCSCSRGADSPREVRLLTLLNTHRDAVQSQGEACMYHAQNIPLPHDSLKSGKSTPPDFPVASDTSLSFLLAPTF